jgi:hypothetical protein
MYRTNIQQQIQQEKIQQEKIQQQKIQQKKREKQKREKQKREKQKREKQKYIDAFIKNKVYHLHNSYHLGDNVFNCILFYLIKEYIEHNNITIFYYAKKEYHVQLKEFICSENVCLSCLDLKPPNSIELWIDDKLFDNRNEIQKNPSCFNEFYKIFFNEVLNKLKIPINIPRFYYEDPELLNRYNNIHDKYKNFDILILNSQPLSGQFKYNKSQWDNYIIHLNTQFNILTTTKVNNDILCTMDDNLTVKDIAYLSTQAKVIIAVNSGVIVGLFNIYTLKNVRHVYVFDRIRFYSYPNFENKQNITDISVDELKKYII